MQARECRRAAEAAEERADAAEAGVARMRAALADAEIELQRVSARECEHDSARETAETRLRGCQRELEVANGQAARARELEAQVAQAAAHVRACARAALAMCTSACGRRQPVVLSLLQHGDRTCTHDNLDP